MSSSGLLTEIRKHPWILALVIVVHLGLLVLLSINLADNEAPPMPMAKKNVIIDAVAVDAKKYDEREKQKKLAAQQAAKKAAEKKRQAELERKKALEKKQLEKKRLAEKKKADELKRKKAAEKKKADEKAKALALAKKKEQERIKKEKLAAEKREAERLTREKKEKERLEKERLAAEKKRREEEERKRRAEEKAEFERALLEEERMEEEARRQAERAARLQTQGEQYMIQIRQHVENNWLRPVGNAEDQSCEVRVIQAISGDVLDVIVQSCTGDNTFQRSVERAVRKASPLPTPPDPELFQREIHFTFKPH